MNKKAYASIFVILISLSLIINAHSATIDGIDNGYEWDGALSCQFINGESNCDVDYAIMRLLIDNENRAVYFCFMFSDPEFEPDNMYAGVSFSINDSDTFIITGNTKSDDYDISRYSFDGMLTIDKNHGATCEVYLGFKEGVPQNINGNVSFIDGNGMSSNKYDFSIVNEGYTERTASQIMNQDDKDFSTSKTTKSKATTKRDNDITDAKSERPSNRRTTTERIGYTTDEFIISTSPSYIYSRTSKPAVSTSETERTSADKSTTGQKSTTEYKTKNNKTKKETVTVYYYEKEIIIYSDIGTELIEITSAPISTTTNVESNNVSETTGSEISTSVSVSDGIKYKTVICAISAVLILSLAAWAAKTGKNNKDTTDQ